MEYFHKFNILTIITIFIIFSNQKLTCLQLQKKILKSFSKKKNLILITHV